MLKIGCHLSMAKGYKKMGLDALLIGANTFQYFTRNPRGSKAKAINLQDINDLQMCLEQNHFTPLLAHAPYTLNACAADPKLRKFAQTIMQEDLANLEYLPGNFYNLHPGSHVKQGVPTGICLIAELLNTILHAEQNTIVLLETMSGKGSEIGSKFEEIKAILDEIELSEKIGVCLDVCHVFSAGYDIVNHLDDVIKEFDQVIGLKKLYAIHLNDSMNPLGSHKDQHTRIGEGAIGLDALANLVNHPQLYHLPFILETPNDLAGHAKEIQLIRDLYQH